MKTFTSKYFSALLVTASLLVAQPHWFRNTPVESFEIIGSGVDADIVRARNLAKSEISETLQVQISSQSSSNKQRDSKGASSQFRSQSTSKSQAVLQGIRIGKEEQKKGKWFVSAIYDNRSLLQKINASSKRPIAREKLLARLLDKELVLSRNANIWSVRVATAKANILLGENEISSFFVTGGGDDLSCQSSQDIFQSNEPMSIRIDSKQNGFISIFSVEQNGKVGTLLKNQKITKTLIYPPPQAKSTLIAYNGTKTSVQEMLVCVLTKQKQKWSMFESTSDILLDESNYNFHKLIEQSTKHAVATAVIKIRGSL